MLSEKIKKLRQSKHYSQKQIAIKLGITQGAVSQWELGLTEPGADQLIALAQIFDTTVYELKGIDDPTKKEPAHECMSRAVWVLLRGNFRALKKTAQGGQVFLSISS